MPLILEKDWLVNSKLGIWQWEEGEESFMEKMELTEVERTFLNKAKGRRRREWLTSRWLIHHMTGFYKRAPCLVDEFGKPHLANTDFEISISHSSDHAAVLFSEKPIGVDIQRLVDKIGRIEHKFMREEESAALNEEHKIEHLHVFWGAKESMYKAYGRKKLDFRGNMSILPFHFMSSGVIKGIVRKEEFCKEYTIQYERFNDFMLVGAEED